MARFERKWIAVSGLAVIALLAGCSGTTPASRVVAAATAERGSAWVLPEASDENLLYVATGANVYVLSYPGGKLVGELDVEGNNICSDKHGDVFVPEGGYQIAEYSHGGASPIQVLYDGDIRWAAPSIRKPGISRLPMRARGRARSLSFPARKGRRNGTATRRSAPMGCAGTTTKAISSSTEPAATTYLPSFQKEATTLRTTGWIGDSTRTAACSRTELHHAFKSNDARRVSAPPVEAVAQGRRRIAYRAVGK